MRLQVNDFMTPTVLSAEGSTPVGEIRNMMKRNGIHAIPITDQMPDGEWHIQGIVTATDLCRKVDETLPISEVMTDCRVHVISGNMGAQAAAKTMLKNNLHHLVVMENGKMIGMVSSLDFVKLVSEYLLEPKLIVET